MSNASNDNSVDEKELDEYLSSNTQYSLRYRKLEADDVPAEMDRLVLGKIQEGTRHSATVTPIETVKAKRSLSYWMRVGAPIALAASFVLVVSIVVRSGLQNDMPNVTVASQDSVVESKPATEGRLAKIDMPRTAEAPTVAPTPAAKKTSPAKASSAPIASPHQAEVFETVTVTARKREPTVQEMPISVVRNEEVAKSEVQPAAPAVITSSIAARAKEVGDAEKPAYEAKQDAKQKAADKLTGDEPSGKALQNLVATGAANNPQQIAKTEFERANMGALKLTKQQREEDPAAWLQFIRRLRTDRRMREANDEWQRFVKAYPAYPVAENDSARAK